MEDQTSNPPVLPPLTADEKNMAMLSHLLALSGYVIPFGNILGPLIIFLIKKDQSPYVRDHAVESLNFQISLLIYTIVSAVLIFVIIGFFLIFAVAIAGLILCIMAGLKASEGQLYRYPLTIRFVK